MCMSMCIYIYIYHTYICIPISTFYQLAFGFVSLMFPKALRAKGSRLSAHTGVWGAEPVGQSVPGPFFCYFQNRCSRSIVVTILCCQ